MTNRFRHLGSILENIVNEFVVKQLDYKVWTIKNNIFLRMNCAFSEL